MSNHKNSYIYIMKSKITEIRPKGPAHLKHGTFQKSEGKSVLTFRISSGLALRASIGVRQSTLDARIQL